MAARRTLRSYHFYALLKPPNLTNTHHHKSSLLPSIFRRPISLSVQVDAESNSSDSKTEQNEKTKKKPLHALFKEAVGLSEKFEHSDSENDSETNELKKRLRKLEQEVKRLKGSPSGREKVQNLKKVSKSDGGVSKGEPKRTSLYALFGNKGTESEKTADVESIRMQDQMVYRELSPDMVLFVTHLHKKGYFSNANFLPGNKLDVSCFENSYGRDFVKYAAEKFGKNNQEIARWLSASDLKKVALFGCPSLGRKNVFSAKRLRAFFGIQEETVCSKCGLKPLCKFANQSVWKGDIKNLNLAVVMRVITLYALESVPPQLVVPNEIKDSVSRLLKEAVNLSQTME